MTLLAATVVSLVRLAPLCVHALQGVAASGPDTGSVRIDEQCRAGSSAE